MPGGEDGVQALGEFPGRLHVVKLKLGIAEHIRKRRAHACLVGDFGVVGATFVDNLQGDAIAYGLPHGVCVDVVAKDDFGLVNRRAGIADLCRVRDGRIEIRPELFVLGTMGFVGHDQDVGAGIQLGAGIPASTSLRYARYEREAIGPERKARRGGGLASGRFSKI